MVRSKIELVIMVDTLLFKRVERGLDVDAFRCDDTTLPEMNEETYGTRSGDGAGAKHGCLGVNSSKDSCLGAAYAWWTAVGWIVEGGEVDDVGG